MKCKNYDYLITQFKKEIDQGIRLLIIVFIIYVVVVIYSGLTLNHQQFNDFWITVTIVFFICELIGIIGTIRKCKLYKKVAKK